jgi:penicillin-binding protein 2
MIATENQFRKVRVVASRGLLLDRKGRILAGNRPGFNLTLIPADINTQTVTRLAEILNVPEDALRQKIKESQQWTRYVPVTIQENLSWQTLSRLEEHLRELSGVDIEYRPIRSYPMGQIACHLLGYIGEVSPEELEQPEYAGYQVGDYVGKAGVEKLFEKWLKGNDGYKFKIVDAQGRERPPDIIPGLRLEPQAPAPGRDIRLTIDMDLEELAQNLLSGKAGAIVMLSVKDGEVLAMVSSPTFSPELFGSAINPAEWKKVESDQDHPLLNRPIQGAYPPGSVFKLTLALAGLGDNIIDPNQKLHCSGVFMFGNIPFKCWRKGGHGNIALQDAIIQSCDIYFYQRGIQLGIDRIAHYANLLGLGVKSGIGLQSENSGLIPTSAWRENVRGEKWRTGDTVSAAIGQGFILVTPLQAAMMAMTIANEGKLYKPTLLESVADVPEQSYEEFLPKLIQKANISAKNWKLVKDAMTGVVNDPAGTAYWGARSDKVKIAGKTGTAQVIKSKTYEGMPESAIPEKYHDHAWFISYAPAESPRVAVAVLVEHGGHGASAAAPLARAMIEKYMELYPEGEAEAKN